MDLSAFYASYRADGHGRPAYDPAMMVALVLYAYARGTRSSRAIERACEDDVPFRVLAANCAPDHATIARLVERHQDALAELFGAVLELCVAAGLVRVGVVAVDGTKLHANASRDQTMGYEQIAREILTEAQAIDAAEDEIHGEARGDELPPKVATSQGRRGWLRDAAAARSAPRRGGAAGAAVTTAWLREPSAAWRKSSTSSWHLEQMRNVVARGTQVLIPPDCSRRKSPRPRLGWRRLRVHATRPCH